MTDAPSRWTRVRRRLPFAMLIAAAIAIALRLTVRDGIDLLAPFVHGTPPAVCAGAAAVAGLLLLQDRRRRWAAAAVTIAVGLAVWHLAVMHVIAIRPPAPDGAARVVVWNVRHGKHGFASIEDELIDLDPDVIGLIEGGDDSDRRRAAWAAAFPDHEAFYGKSGLILLVRGAIVRSRVERLGDEGRAIVAELVVGSQRVRVVLVDVKTDRFDPRGPVFEALESLVAALPDGPLLVAGDFNTPHNSVHFDRWRNELNLTHAFESAGIAGRATWPDPFPVIEIDHAWVNGSLSVHRCRHPDVASSDHRPVVFDVAVR